jgi:predicted transcriptional regulator
VTTESLSRRERQIMNIVYRLGEATAAQILADMADPPSNSAVRALLRIMIDKKHLQHREDGPRFVYSATLPRQTARTRALAQVVNTFFDGSALKAASALLGSSQRKLTKAELDELGKLIDAARKKGQ